jgi:hypothetical protein
MSEKTILTTVPFNLKGRGHNRCVPMQCICGCQFLFGLSDGTEKLIGGFDQIDVKCPSCMAVTSEPTAPLRDPKNIHDGQSGLPAGVNT